MLPFEGVLFDVDGTLIDSNDAHAEAWLRAFDAHGYKVTFPEIRERIGKGGDKMVMELVGLKEDDPTAMAINEDRADFFLEQLVPTLHGFPAARDLIQRMKEDGLRIGVASSAKTDELKALLKIARIADLIEAQTSSDDAENSKPDPDIVVAAVEKLGLPADRVVMLGDTPYDVQAAARAGVAVIAVRSGGWEAEELAGAIAVYNDVADLFDNYDESPLGVAAVNRSAAS
ncbi:HAD family hydrolase [Paludisphaera rhizosphaerae]|uniref:HAD family hydrolase n=1 Tax=Paludisphaera rhizosphaerae TaxID=2711216 RepID=UPI0019825291|nr:HAD family hydrolase [Paludisphaera rhizosphaerae]